MFETKTIIILPVLVALYLLLIPLPLKAASQGWQLIWNDEFDGPNGSAIDSSKWEFDTGGGGFGNGEAEYYTDRIDNVYLENGCLVIKALKEEYEGCKYTSGRIKTKGKFEPQYGRIEARIKIPYGQGIWPAFWMLGNDIDINNWPGCGEIDIMENLGRELYAVHGSMHGPGYSGIAGHTASTQAKAKLADGFHVYAVEWEPKEIRWYFNEKCYFSQTPDDIPGQWVFDHPFFILLNIAVGGAWPGYPDTTTIFPQQMLVDYVRVYEFSK